MYHTYIDRLQARFDQDVVPKMGIDSRVDGIDVLFEPQRAFPVSLLAPALDNAGRLALETRLKRDTAKLAVALERQRRSSGGWPANSLEVLAPEFIQTVPNCPYDGAPLRYELREGRPWVWSVGDDYSDDGAIDDITRMKTMNTPRRTNVTSGEDLLLWIGPAVN